MSSRQSKAVSADGQARHQLAGAMPQLEEDQGLGAYLRRQRSRLGAHKAITAAAHKLARILYHLMRCTTERMAQDQATTEPAQQAVPGRSGENSGHCSHFPLRHESRKHKGTKTRIQQMIESLCFVLSYSRIFVIRFDGLNSAADTRHSPKR
jgi:hypothetical protein